MNTHIHDMYVKSNSSYDHSVKPPPLPSLKFSQQTDFRIPPELIWVTTLVVSLWVIRKFTWLQRNPNIMTGKRHSNVVMGKYYFGRLSPYNRRKCVRSTGLGLPSSHRLNIINGFVGSLLTTRLKIWDRLLSSIKVEIYCWVI